MAIYLHLYEKESMSGRKIGHVTITGFVSIKERGMSLQPLVKIVDKIRQDTPRIQQGAPPTTSNQASSHGEE
jgi:phosphoribosylaminoimidazole carboxylase